MLSAVLLASTYSTLIGAGARMSSTTKIPLMSIEQNIGALLSLTWPNASSSVTEHESDISQDAIRLLYVGKMDKDERGVARGLRQSRASPEQPIYSPPLWLTGGSPLTKSIVQLSVGVLLSFRRPNASLPRPRLRCYSCPVWPRQEVVKLIHAPCVSMLLRLSAMPLVMQSME